MSSTDRTVAFRSRLVEGIDVEACSGKAPAKCFRRQSRETQEIDKK